MPTPHDPDFRDRVLGALDLSPADLPTLRSVLGVQIACELEVAREPVYPSSALTRSAGDFPRRASMPITVQQAMVLAADTGVEVVLTVEVDGEPTQHRCRVGRTSAELDPTVFSIEPEINTQRESITLVRTGSSSPGLNLVTGCWPAKTKHKAEGRVISGLVLLPDQEPTVADEIELRLPPTIRGADFHVVEAVDDGWVMEAGHENADGPFGEKYVRQGDVRETKPEATIDAWALANEILTGDLEAALRKLKLAEGAFLPLPLSTSTTRYLVNVQGDTWTAEIRRTIGRSTYGSNRSTRVEAVVDAWALALGEALAPLTFHTAWGRAKEQDDYCKDDWRRTESRRTEVHTFAEWLAIIGAGRSPDSTTVSHEMANRMTDSEPNS